MVGIVVNLSTRRMRSWAAASEEREHPLQANQSSLRQTGEGCSNVNNANRQSTNT
jgi:hypothetical protein